MLIYTALMENKWLTYAKKLEAIASTGAHFGESDFDLERYEEVREIAHQMLADLGNVPVTVISNLIPDYGSGYATPKTDVRGAVIRNNEILLVREKLDGKWTLPGGYADTGLSPASNICKEIAEEASLQVKASKLYAVFHKAAHHYDADTRDFYKMYFLCEQLDDASPAPGAETLDAAFFPRDRLPELSTGRVIAPHIDLAFEFAAEPGRPTLFD